MDYEKTTPEDVWLLQRPNGIIFVTGLTGSGKTTTLYAALRAILRQDPVWCWWGRSATRRRRRSPVAPR